MFRIIKRLIKWTGKYKKRIYIGFLYAFLHSIFTAIPIILAAKGLESILDDFNGIVPLEMFFASTFWTKLQNIFGHCCMSILDKVAKPDQSMLRPAI